ncbi:DUF6309 family protein [Endozoicomonas sp. 8E]|uniref:DUF6309 family protein n=1 Tax=Endozoicomonas sp. 8E TaxID=3035692 RepID=UPI0029394A13|nr:DUF6309 family protein [Endozoicomonas sp. 8E]WOG25880.1 DUF6309 family protein [Endozoicomonas sp. 8E]
MDAVSLSGMSRYCYHESSFLKQKDSTEKQMPVTTRLTENKSISEYSVANNSKDSLYGSAKIVSFQEVLDNFEKEHGQYGDTNWIAKSYIKMAHREIVLPNHGVWLFAELPFETAMKVLLPGHTHDGERKTLLPECGLTAKDAANNYKVWTEQDKRNNPLCSGSLNYHLGKDPAEKPIFLTVEPIDSRYDYGKIIDDPKFAEGRLVHLDGLHRLVSLAIKDDPESTIPAFIACKTAPKKIDGLGAVSRSGIENN